jgi:hypothetical protein
MRWRRLWYADNNDGTMLAKARKKCVSCVSALTGRQIALKLLYYYEGLVILEKRVTRAPSLTPILFYYFSFSCGFVSCLLLSSHLLTVQGCVVFSRRVMLLVSHLLNIKQFIGEKLK